MKTHMIIISAMYVASPQNKPKCQNINISIYHKHKEFLIQQ